MTKAYSNKALPAGTVLREWRLEEVLGVGGFGIVYKGRGIYFDELVAIKEYFPSSISERDAEDTVVPIDSDAEEVHALGLKKFVEEAKLLWNLSTPTRHPNIVSVRSLFEIHGTAYMVMDFEDGVSLSKLLKNGTKFNERSLWNLIRPVAEGLDRAHRVGVLHRDIKPPNILITDENRPVLIDFGSARFEAAEATSTKVTFHTPPYAAIEQYVKTYPQGPWTDIYALGVVLYECVTGSKPPEVLERMHGGLGERLSDGKWPGYSKKFLAAIDAAMTIRPQERPQSIAEWLEMFGKSEQQSDDGDEAEATRISTHELAADEIVPVAPPAAGFAKPEAPKTQIPDSPEAVQFKRAGHETKPRKKAATAAAAKKAESADKKDREAALVAPAAPADREDSPSKPAGLVAIKERLPSPAVMAGAAAALLAVSFGAWFAFGGDGTPPDGLAAPATASASATAFSDLEVLPAALRALADDASKAGAPMSAVTELTAASERLAQLYRDVQAASSDPEQAAVAGQRADQLRKFAMKADVDFARALLTDAEAKAERLSAAAPWASPASERSAAGESPARQQIAANLRTSISQLRSAVDAAARAPGPAQAHDYARLALTQAQSFTAATLAAYNNRDTMVASAAEAPDAPAASASAPARPATATATASRSARTAAASTAATSSATTLSPAKISELNSIIDDARRTAKQVIRLGSRSGSGQAREIRRANARLARDYDENLATLKASGRGIRSDREADRLIAQARQTRAYVQFLLTQSNAAR